jgi:hypothetical protein
VRHRGKRTSLLVAVTLTASALLLSACGGPSGDALAHEACLDVQRSISYYHQSTVATTAATQTSLARKAQAALRAALQPAALAGGGGGQWEALAMTLSESNRVSEARLVTALSAQCAASLETN